MAKYKCEFCGSEYDSPIDRAKCEIKCDKEQRTRKEQEKMKIRKQAEKESKENIDRLLDQYLKAVNLHRKEFYDLYIGAVSEHNLLYIPYTSFFPDLW